MKPKLTLVFLFLINFAYGQKLEWIPFNWVGDSVSGKYLDKLAMTIPVTIENLPHKFNMQFDLGAVTTTFYGNAIQLYKEQYPILDSKIDTTLTFVIQGQKNYKFKDVSLKLGDVPFGKRNIGYFKDFGDEIPKDSIFTVSEKHIGTIAPDLFKDKVLIIDFPNQRICVSDSIPKQFKLATFKKFKMKDGRIKIPLSIDGKEEEFMYDSGSSLFALITSKEKATQISENTISDSLEVSSWGEKLVFYGRKINSEIEFGKIRLEPALVYYDDLHPSSEFYDEEQIWGIIGNRYFLNRTIIIDYKSQFFGIK